MLKSDIVCPYCGLEISAAIWVDSCCENCGANYHWSVEFNEDYSDGWHIVSWDKSKSIYVATTLSNWERARAFIDLFKKAGVPIAFDWTRWGEEIFTTERSCKPRDTNPASLQEKALNEYEGVSSATYILTIVPTGRGTNFELGAAYQRFAVTGSPIIAILDEEEPTAPISFHYLPGIRRMQTTKEAIIDVLTHFGIDIKDIDASNIGVSYARPK